MNDNSHSQSAATGFVFEIAREFAAPRAVIFDAWTQCAHLKRWFGPKDMPMLECRNDLRVGGMLLYQLQTPDGLKFWGRWIYREITPPERLEVLSGFSDESGGLTRHPWGANWPLQMLSLTTFAERDGRTQIAVRWSPYEATAAELSTFYEGRDSMHAGWTGTFDKLEQYLAQQK